MPSASCIRLLTLEERINIVEECINTGCNYASTANKYGCSYGQVYAWVRKYKDKGIEGLYDRRGKNKAISQLSDIEKLKAENRLLKAQTQQQQMEIDFLKKLDEIERRWTWPRHAIQQNTLQSKNYRLFLAFHTGSHNCYLHNHRIYHSMNRIFL